MRFFLLIFASILFILSCGRESKKIQREQSRIEKSFNSDWFFIIDSIDHGEEQGWFTIDRFPKETHDVEIPHTWNVMKEYEMHYGTGWYFKFFNIPGTWEEKLIRLRFNAIYRDAKFWVNGHSITERTGAGYTPFEIDLSDILLFGEKNFIAIKVSNLFSNQAIPYENKFDWPADGGIIRSVELIKTERPSIRYLHVLPHLYSGFRGKLNIVIGLAGYRELDLSELDVWYQIREHNQPTSEIIDEGNRKSKIYEDQLNFELELNNIKPWHFITPNLYRIKIAIGQNMVLTDHDETIFGFRSFVTEGIGLFFNGEKVRLPGIEWMPGSSPEQGMAEDTMSMNNMLTMLKNTNAVFTRFHWQQDDYILTWCDENGILVQEEIPLWQAPFPDQLNRQIRDIAHLHLQEMILAHFNHPSIISWGIGNELYAQNDTIKAFLSGLKNQISVLDSSRLINYVSNTLHQDPLHDGTTQGDILMWNDYSGLWYDLSENGLSSKMLTETLLKINRSIPDMPLIISEYGLCEPVFKGGDPRRIEHFLYNTEIYDKHDFIGGVIYFSLNDYRTHMGEEGNGRRRRRVHGIVDIHGNKKPSYTIIKERFSPIRDLHGQFINENFHVTGKNHDGLPSFSIRNYKVRIYGKNSQLLAEEEIPVIRPGQKFNVVFRGLNQAVTTIRIVTGNGFLVTIKET